MSILSYCIITNIFAGIFMQFSEIWLKYTCTLSHSVKEIHKLLLLILNLFDKFNPYPAGTESVLALPPA